MAYYARTQRTSGQNGQTLTILLVMLLCAVTAAGGFILYRLKATERELEEVRDIAEQRFPIETIRKFANESDSFLEFYQRFYEDCIVLQNSGSDPFLYIPIDWSLPQNSYDWNCLRQVEGKSHREYEYIENGRSVAKKGIDVSTFQKEIDWGKVAEDGVEYAFLRAGYRGYGNGAIREDARFQQNLKGAQDNGVEVGIYFFSQAITPEEAVEEAEWVLDAIRGHSVTYPIVIDVENADPEARMENLGVQELTDVVIAFCDRIARAGYTPMIYTNVRWFATRLDLSRLTQYPKWLARYAAKPFFPYDFQIWQYSSTGRVNGIEGDVDLNLCWVDYAASHKSRQSNS